ncbi:hypothetical protein AALD74_01850 [Lachnospiraceae bacterium 48-21]
MIIFDFDGTLNNLWMRFHRVFCDLLSLEDITLETYKKVKQLLIKDELVAMEFGKTLPYDYFSRKREMLEAKKYLALDELFFPKEDIEKWIHENQGIIVTKRYSQANLKWQLQSLGLDVPVAVVKAQSKRQWIQENIRSKDLTIIGDSLMDLDAGKLPYVKPVMVGYGLGTRSQFDKNALGYTLLDEVHPPAGHALRCAFGYTFLESTEEVQKYMEEKNAVS